MKARRWYGCSAGLVAGSPLTVALTLTLALALVPAGSVAGIQRPVDEPQTAKPQTAKPQTPKPQTAEPSDNQPEAAGKREEPSGKAAPSDRGGSGTGDKVLQLPKQLWARAKVLAKVAVKPLASNSGRTAASQDSSREALPRQSLPRRGFACCNLHHDGDSINDGNYGELPMIAAGTPIEVLSYGRNKAYVKVDGKSMRLEHDYGRDQESLESWVGKIVVDDDPRPRIDGYTPAIREAIREGKVLVGMSREQAIAAIGYPLTSENPSLDAPVWRIWRSRRGEYQLNFRSDGHLASVSGDDEVISKMVYRAGR